MSTNGFLLHSTFWEFAVCSLLPVYIVHLTWFPPFAVSSKSEEEEEEDDGAAKDRADEDVESEEEDEAKTLTESIVSRSSALFGQDRACPIEWEPSGFDFLSPCLQARI